MVLWGSENLSGKQMLQVWFHLKPLQNLNWSHQKDICFSWKICCSLHFLFKKKNDPSWNFFNISVTFKVLLLENHKFSSILIFSVCCFVSITLPFPPPASIFPHFVIVFLGLLVLWELSVWEHMCTYMVLIRMPLTSPGPLTLGCFSCPGNSLTSYFSYYSWC